MEEREGWLVGMGISRARSLRRPHPLRRRPPRALSSMQAAVAGAAKTEITLKGSTEIVTEFFGYSINR